MRAVMRALCVTALLGLSGCGAVPVAAWVAIGAVAGAVSATAQLDVTAINAYLALRGKQVASIAPPIPSAIAPTPSAQPAPP